MLHQRVAGAEPVENLEALPVQAGLGGHTFEERRVQVEVQAVGRLLPQRHRVATLARADEQTRTADLLQLRVIGQPLQGLLRLTNPAYLSCFLFSGLQRVAPYCVPGAVRMVSKVREFHVTVCMSSQS
jgi:hypothetical protein